MSWQRVIEEVKASVVRGGCNVKKIIAINGTYYNGLDHELSGKRRDAEIIKSKNELIALLNSLIDLIDREVIELRRIEIFDVREEVNV